MKTILASLLLSQMSWSNTAIVGNGGDGMMINGKPYLFDLVEAGIHESPRIDRNIHVSKKLSTRVNTSLTRFPKKVRDGVASKIAEILSVDKFIGLWLLKTMESYQWALVPFSLKNIPDEDGTDIQIPLDQLVQLAVRSRRSIRVDSDLANQMDSENLVATIFHEVVHAVIKPETIETDERVIVREYENENGDLIREYENRKYQRQDSRRVREVTSYLFLGEIRATGLHAILGTDFPTSKGGFALETPLANTLLTEPSLQLDTYISWESETFPEFTADDQRRFQYMVKQTCRKKNNFTGIRLAGYFKSLEFKFSSYKGKNRNPRTYLDWKFISGFDRRFSNYLPSISYDREWDTQKYNQKLKWSNYYKFGDRYTSPEGFHLSQKGCIKHLFQSWNWMKKFM